MAATTATELDNPLTAGLERQPVAPTTLVIFGATGDLARRKLLPALYNLAHEGALPERFHLVGIARKHKADEELPHRMRGGDPPLLASQARRRGALGPARRRQVRRRHVRRRRRVLQARRDPRRLRQGSRRGAEPRLLPVDGAQLLPRDRRGARQLQARPPRARARCASSSRSPSGRRCRRRASSTAACSRSSKSPRSSASTTTSARRRSRTCWRSASPTACSSRCGTATTSTASRSPPPRTSASARAPTTTTPPARCAT